MFYNNKIFYFVIKCYNVQSNWIKALSSINFIEGELKMGLAYHFISPVGYGDII